MGKDRKPGDALFEYDSKDIDHLRTVARMANVTEDVTDDFLEMLAMAIDAARCGWIDLGGEYARDKQVNDAAAAMRTARNKIGMLSLEQQRAFTGALTSAVPRWLEHHLVGGEHFSAWFERHPDENAPEDYWVAARDIAEYLDDALGVMTGRAPHHAPTAKRGRPKGSLSEWPLRYFINELIQIVHGCSGTLDFGKVGQTNEAQGLLVDAMIALKPVLPQGFVTPSIKVHSFLEEAVNWKWPRGAEK
jgi:hypothetical protein